MKVVERELNSNLLNEYKNYLFIGDKNINSTNKRFIEVKDNNNNTISIAMISLADNKVVDEVIEENLYYLIEDNELDEIEYLHEKLDDRIYLDAIYSIVKGKNGAKEIINYLENKYNKIWLYSACEAEEYWEKLGWNSIEEHVYIQ
jgi:hypothetical protein